MRYKSKVSIWNIWREKINQSFLKQHFNKVVSIRTTSKKIII